jgi:Leucine-rich repeat (LRR) protein
VLVSGLNSTCAGRLSAVEYQALQDIFTATDGAQWRWDPVRTNASVWHFPSSLSAPCVEDWQGIYCDYIVELGSEDYECTVAELDVSDRNLTGALPSSIQNLANVHYLALSFNRLTGTLPCEIGAMSNLAILYTNMNQFSGVLPSELGLLVKMEVFDISRNRLDGTIPTQFGQFVAVQEFDMSSNLLTGSIPDQFGNLGGTHELYFDNNYATGSIPSIFSGTSSLLELGMNHNFLTGAVLAPLSEAVSLQVLNAELNAFTGPLPPSLGQLVNLNVFSIFGNQFTGGIPEELCDLASLSQLYLSFNALQGSIPARFASFVNLTEFVLSNNMLTGNVPDIADSIIDVDLSNNYLTGSIFERLGHGDRLKALNIGCNYFSGALFSNFSVWVNLQSLNLSSNLFSGLITPSAFQVEKLVILRSVDLSNNFLGGILNSSLFTLPKLQTLSLSQNCFSGAVPYLICQSNAIENLVLDALTQNCGSGIPSWLQFVFKGFIPTHFMEGSIPSCIWEMSTLQVLHLAGNGLSGSLPDTTLPGGLGVVALGSNLLTGTIPQNFQSHMFTQFDLSLNKLHGILSESLQLKITATLFTLNVNRLSGRLPDVLFQDFNDGVLDILDGNLYGCAESNIPPSDTNRKTYQCGSIMLEYSFYVWISAFGLFLLSVWVTSRQYQQQFKAWIKSLNSNIFKLVLVVHGFLALVSIVVAAVGYLLFKVPTAWNPMYVTRSVQYWWTISVAFLHGWQVVLFLLVLITVASTFLPTMILLQSGSMVSVAYSQERLSDGSSFLAPESRVSVLSKKCVLHTINVVVILFVNAMYVLEAVNQLATADLFLVQAVLSMFKLGWSSMAIPWIELRTVSRLSRLSHSVFIRLFIFIGAPVASTLFESSSCFLYLLERQPSFTSSFVVPSIDCNSQCGTVCTPDGCISQCPEFCGFTSESTVYVDVPPPWLYSYQCSSAVITNYVPVLLLSYCLSGLLIPLSFVSYAFVANEGLASRLPGGVANLTERLLLSASPISALKVLKEGSGRDVVLNIMIKLFLNMTVLLTFGLASPLLAIAVVVDGVVDCAVWHYVVERYAALCEQEGESIEQVKTAVLSNFELNGMQLCNSLYCTMGFVGIFWSLFVFDMIGDVYGNSVGALCMLFPLLLPISACYLTIRLLPSIDSRASTMVAKGVELRYIANPIVTPQGTSDGFS